MPGTPTRLPGRQPLANIIPRTARGSKPLEVIGTYDPMPKPNPYDNQKKLHKDINLDISRAKYWIGVGAQPTDRMWSILSMAGVLPKKTFEAKTKAESATVDASKVRVL